MDLRRGGKAAIDRIIEAYGLTTKQALCDKLGISSSTLANRYIRDTFPADYVVQCAIETGVSIEWLAFGKGSKSSIIPPEPEPQEQTRNDTVKRCDHQINKYPIEININPNQGGKAAIERLVEAYGFTTRQALADHLGVSKSTLANRYMRDTFPGDWIIRCALETGASLKWLTTGNGPAFNDARNDIITIPYKKIIDGTLQDDSFLILDEKLSSNNYLLPFALFEAGNIYIAESKFDEVTDGKWLVEIEGRVSIKDLSRIPVGRVKITNNDTSFECLLSDIKAIAKCKSVFIKTI